MKILVTGSEGLIGSILCKKLSKNFQPVRYDLKNGKNILNVKSLKKELKSCDGVIHLAAVSRVITAYKNPLLSIKHNILGTANILENIRQINPKIWCVYASSREVYGESKNKVKESDPLNPINVYGATKYSGESLMNTYHLNYGLNTFVVRFSNVYGSINDHKDRVIPIFLNQASKNKDITVFGGSQTFDFVHVQDATDGMMKLISKIVHNKAKHRTYHFVSGKGANLMELANLIIKTTKSKSEIKKMKSRNFDVNFFIGNPNLAKKDLNWTAKIHLEQGLKKYWKEIQQQ